MKTPKAPDPAAVAAAQQGYNTDTALTQQQVNMTDQVGPWGSTTYNPSGSSSFVDSTGKTVTVPRYTQTTTYSPEQQAIFDKTEQAQTNLADLSVTQSGKMKEYLDTPFSFNNQDAADWAYDMGASRIRPEQERQEEALRTHLVNAGLRPGTTAWDAEMKRQQYTNNDQWNQLALTGRSQAFGEAKAIRDQPINEIGALLSGSQINAPNSGFSATPQANIGGVDYTGLVSQNYQTQAQNAGGALGGLFGLAGTLGGAAIKKWG